MPRIKKRVFDRVAIPRQRPKQLNHPIEIEGPTIRPWRYHFAGAPFLDQGSEGACVGFGLAHQLNAGPVICKPLLTANDARAIYLAAQRHDEWPGEYYSGSSVNGGALALRDELKRIVSFRWAFDLDTVVDAVLRLGPVTLGTDWYTGMLDADSKGRIKISGDLEGGHAYLLCGVNKITRRAKIKNSWGKTWGDGGFAYLSFDDLERLISQQGEACIVTEIPVSKKLLGPYGSQPGESFLNL